MPRPSADNRPSLRRCYEELGLDRSAAPAEVRARYKELVREWHPDRNPDPGAADRLKKIIAAFETIRDAPPPEPPTEERPPSTSESDKPRSRDEANDLAYQRRVMAYRRKQGQCAFCGRPLGPLELMRSVAGNYYPHKGCRTFRH